MLHQGASANREPRSINLYTIARSLPSVKMGNLASGPVHLAEAPMAKKAAKAAPKHVEPEDVSHEEMEPLGGGQEGHGVVSKAEAIRRALSAGMDSPEDGVAYIKSRFGLEVSNQHFSATKSQIKSKGGGTQSKGKPGRKPKAAVEGYLAPPPKPAPAGGSDLLEAMEAMKPLVASLGKEQVKRIVDLLG
jgi:hypothetical protein